MTWAFTRPLDMASLCRGHQDTEYRSGLVRHYMIKVMLFDDDAAVCLTVRMVLEHAGSDVIGEGKRSGRGQEAQVPKPDLALLDIDMPKMSGMDALMEIIKHDD
ncbi:MAG: response regulator [Rhodospirillaceae bacterium]|nr:response regulator [Rhodospirillaceae bacterium]